MCDLYLSYYEDENIFMDDDGEVIYDIFSLITPSNLFLFHHDCDKYDTFPMVGQEEVTCRLLYIPADTICRVYKLPKINPKTAYKYFEQYERTRMANVTG